jgi:hypothetical protein
MSKHRTTVFLEQDMLNAIRKVSKADGRPMAYHYDGALRAYGPIKKLTAKPKQSKGLAAIAVIPEEINQGAWLEWLRSPSSKITEASKAKQFKLLAGYSMADQQSIIDASINSGWQGLFALKGVQKPAEGSFTEGHTDKSWRDDI